MSLYTRVRDYFNPPKLRNKPGGMAWITARIDEGEGAGALVGRVVRTVSMKPGDFWVIDPPQGYTVTAHAINRITGMTTKPGDEVRAVSVHDRCLEPIPEIDDDAQDESLRYLPPVPTRTPETA